MTKIAGGDDYEGVNFSFMVELTAGETYYLEAYEFNRDEAGSYMLSVGVPLPTDIFFSEYSLETYTGTQYDVELSIYPEDAEATITWTSSDEEVATVDNEGKVTFLAAGETVIRAETENGLYDECFFTVRAVHGSLTLNEEIEIVLTGKDTRAETQQTFTFTPTKTGYYRFESYDIVTESGDVEVDPRVWVYDVMHKELGYDDDGGEDVNVREDVEMQAGTTYYIMTELYDSKAIGSYKALLKELDTAESVSIDGGDITMEQGDSRDIYVTFSPEGTWQEDYEVTSTDESVVAVDGKTLKAVGEGTVTVTVVTDLGLTDSIEVTVIGAAALELDTEYTLESDAEAYYAYKRYAFTPTVSGRYKIASTETIGEEAHVYVILNDSSEQLRYNNMQDETFSLTYELVAGKTYFYSVYIEASSEESAVSFMLTKPDDSAIPEAKPNIDYDIEIVNGGDGVYYAFKPHTTGMYAIFSEMSNVPQDTKLCVYDADWELFYVNDDGGENGQYRLEEEFTAGETYYLKSIMYSSDIVGSYRMRIEPDFDADQTATIDGTISGVEEDTEVTILLTEDGFSEPSYEVVVSGNSAYEITDVPLATYTITVTADGYVTFEDVCILQDDATINVEMVKGKPSYSVWVYLDEADEYPVFGVSVEEGDTVVEPAEPGREGMAFLGWYADGVKYDFSAPVMGDLHLVAKFGLLGDMNLDGALNTMDALLLFGCVNGAREMTAEQEAVADYTEDGNINMMDALMLYGFASGANSNLDDSQKALSDMNSDGTVNMVDALLLYKVASGR